VVCLFFRNVVPAPFLFFIFLTKFFHTPDRLFRVLLSALHGWVRTSPPPKGHLGPSFFHNPVPSGGSANLPTRRLWFFLLWWHSPGSNLDGCASSRFPAMLKKRCPTPPCDFFPFQLRAQFIPPHIFPPPGTSPPLSPGLACFQNLFLQTSPSCVVSVRYQFFETPFFILYPD